ncbi:MAG: cyclic nucleotide-binding domain-containing protein [Chloroflexi bacterium]|nr:cyclic nucleotide-binding domain-containing protein [Chloroflexota bacterium]
MDELQEKINILRRSEIFLGLRNDVLEHLATRVACRTRSFQPGELVIKVGDQADELFIVGEGKVDLTLVRPSRVPEADVKVVLATISIGGTFGWSTLTGNYAYGLDAVCASPVKVLAISGQELLEFMDRDTATGYEIMKSLSRIVVLRLRDSNRAFFKVLARDQK